MICTLILGGGSGTRMHASKNKVLLPLAGVPILIRSICAFEELSDRIIVVIRRDDAAQAREILDRYGYSGIQLVYGGDTRQASVYAGLKALPEGCESVMIHDGARCLVDRDVIERCRESIEKHGNGIASIPVTDTIKTVLEDGRADYTLERDKLRAMQTPQGFRVSDIMQAHEYAMQTGFIGTDDASLLEHMGLPVYLTEGNTCNIKITRPEDMMIAQNYIQAPVRMHVGHGYDVHQLVEGRPLILCGVQIPHTHGLLGHSDADVALHALMDAMLGACTLGDIGHLFPDTDGAYLNISSMILLKRVREKLESTGASLVNADITICAQKPKLAPYIQQMREQIASCLDMSPNCISVKATTTEHLGFEGRMEGISATAVVLVQRFLPGGNT